MVGAKQFAILRKVIEERARNPIIHNMRLEQGFKNMSGSFLDRMNEKRSSPLLQNMRKAPKEQKDMHIPESVINMITHQVFQNIQNYLRGDRSMMGQNDGKRHIQISIDL